MGVDIIQFVPLHPLSPPSLRGGEEGGGQRSEPRREWRGMEADATYQQPPLPAEEERVKSDMARVGVLLLLMLFGESPSSEAWET